MKAITNYSPIDQAAVQSFAAGADIILISGSKQEQEKAYKALLKAVEKEEITLDRVEESLERIFKLFY